MRDSLDKISTRILRFVPFVLAFFVPLFFLPFTADYFTYNKFYFISVLAGISLLSWCIRSLTGGKLVLTISNTLVPLVVLVAANIISSVWLSPVSHVSLFGQTTLFTALAIIFITTTSSQKNNLLVHSTIYGLISSACIVSLVTVFHYFGLLEKFISLPELSSKQFNLTGGVLPALVFTLPILISTIAFLITTKDWLIKSLLFAGVILMIVASIVNITLILPQNGQPVIYLLPYRASWSIAVDVLKNWQTALLGSGPETYLSAFTRLRPGFLNQSPTLWNLRFPESGSYILTLFTTTGLIGGLAFIYLFLGTISQAIKHRLAHMDDPAYIFLLTLLTSSLLAYFLVPAGIVPLVSGFVSLIALTVKFKILGFKNTRDVNLSLSAKTETEAVYSDIPDTKLSPAGFVLPWVLTLVSVILLSVYWYFAIPAYSASVSIREANALAATNPVGAYLKEVNAAKLDPYNSSYHLILSQFFKNASLSLLNKESATETEKKSAAEYMQRSIDYGKQAATLDPYNVTVWENLADIYSSFIGAAEGAESFAISHLAQAIALEPTNPKLRLKLGILFFNLGDSDQAIKLVSQAIELKQDWYIPYLNISQIYKAKGDNPRALQYLRAGLQYIDTTQEDYTKTQEEIKSLEKVVPAPAASPSAETQE